MTETTSTPLAPLTPDEVAAFHRDGFLVVTALTSAEEIIRLQAIYDQLFAARKDFAAGDRLELAGIDDDGHETLPQVLSPEKYAPELQHIQARERALAIARQLLGPDTERMGDHAILKPGRHGAATPWHQDEAYWDPALEYDALSFWMPLQEATVENGCMQFVPGSHRDDVLPHRHISDDPSVEALEYDGDIADLPVTACPLAFGGATVHGSRTLHYTGPNRSDSPRRAYIMGFGRPARRRAEPRDFYWQRPGPHGS
ncbi:phytanoyl-CoA dioxygenase family protein [Actinopolymorpha sp. B9G3]|uniref:phytanoyl-CoA dioxygenase family protein n=1 Tax=Actinopolymorpha sp. B9G3 TaxID=3158970 RepID=UPI0032D93EE0